MNKIILAVLVVIVFLMSGCSSRNPGDIDKLIEQGEYAKAEKAITEKLSENPDDIQGRLAMVKLLRKKYFPTYDRERFNSPLEGRWSLFPAAPMTSESRSLELLDGLSKKRIFNDQIAEEYYFHLVYNFYRYKYQNEADSSKKISRILNILNSQPSIISDLASFWQKYVSAGYTVNFDWANLTDFFKNYPQSDLLPLRALQKAMYASRNDDKWQKNDSIITRIADFRRQYPDLSLYADSIFIYRQIDDKLAGLRQKNFPAAMDYLNQILEENISVNTNRYILMEQALLEIKHGNSAEGLRRFSDLSSAVQERYEREKLNKKAGLLAFDYGELGMTITNLRQIENPDKKVLLTLWQTYLKVDNESEADNVWKQLQAKLTRSEKKRTRDILYKYHLGKLELSELNLVRSGNSLTIEGTLTNPTMKTYKGIIVTLSVYDYSGIIEKTKEHTIGELYPGRSEKFNAFIDIKNPAEHYSVKGKIKSFQEVK
jgi:hypothetical protein